MPQRYLTLSDNTVRKIARLIDRAEAAIAASADRRPRRHNSLGDDIARRARLLGDLASGQSAPAMLQVLQSVGNGQPSWTDDFSVTVREVLGLQEPIKSGTHVIVAEHPSLVDVPGGFWIVINAACGSGSPNILPPGSSF